MKYVKIFSAILFLISVYANAQVKFDADFESGSVGNVTLIDSATIRVSDTKYITHLAYIVESRFDPINPVDTTLEPSARWFYFRITGAKNKFIYFDFKNTDPLRAVYSYDNNHFVRFEANEAQRSKISKLFTADTVYIAYFTPYTNKFLHSRINQWQQNKDVQVETFGHSTNNRPMQMLTITNADYDDADKLRIWIHARTHTSETPSSWHLDGFIDALLNTNEGEICRKNCIFYIVPFANPDGVAEGLSRSNATGVNQEINWDQPTTKTVAEVKYLKQKIAELTAEKPFDMALNLHSQVANNATFWVHTAATTNASFFRRQMLLAYLNMLNNNAFLAPRNLSFSKLAPRYPEGFFWNNFNDKTLAITLETPYTYYGAQKNWVTPQNLKQFGAVTLNAIAAYFGISSNNKIIIDNNLAKARGKWLSVVSDSVLYLGDDCMQATRNGQKITYKYKKLPAGKYKIYLWNAAKIDAKNNEINKFIEIDEFVSDKEKNFKYTLKSEYEGEIFDALMLFKE